MDTVTLEAKTRDKSLKAKDLLRNNLIPAEYYGHGVENKSVQLDYQSFRRAYRTAGGNTVIELDIDGKEKLNVLVHDVDYHPVTDLITHVDFINVRMDEAIHAKIPLEFVGTSFAVKDLGGTLMTHLNEVEVKCLPRDLIHSIEVSIEPLEDFTHSIFVSDLNVPDTLELINNIEDVVATVLPPRVEEEPEVAEGEAAAEGAAPEAASEGGEAEKSE